MNEQILQEISEFCRARGLAESTFGRRAVNDGKLASRLRNGGRITTDTLERIRGFMARNVDAAPVRRRVLFDPPPSPQRLPIVTPPAPPVASGQAGDDPQRNFRFFDNPRRAPPSRMRRAPTRRAISASSTTGRNICCS